MTPLSELYAVLNEKVNNLINKAEHFVTDDEFQPVQKLVYGMVTAMLLSVVGAIMALIIKK